jgi:hypothetical protein
MCNLLNYQTRYLEENLQQKKKPTEKTDAETVELIVFPLAPSQLSCK